MRKTRKKNSANLSSNHTSVWFSSMMSAKGNLSANAKLHSKAFSTTDASLERQREYWWAIKLIYRGQCRLKKGQRLQRKSETTLNSQCLRILEPLMRFTIFWSEGSKTKRQNPHGVEDQWRVDHHETISLVEESWCPCELINQEKSLLKNPLYTLKIVVVWPYSGKTTLIHRFAYEKFQMHPHL